MTSITIGIKSQNEKKKEEYEQKLKEEEKKNYCCEDEGIGEEGYDSGMDSADEALCEMLGITSLSHPAVKDTDLLHDDDSNNDCGQTAIPQLSMEDIQTKLPLHISETYARESVILFPSSLNIPARTMRRITDELIWGSEKYPSDRTYETITLHNQMQQTRELTRLENFVHGHPEWFDLCHNHVTNCISAALNEPMVLYKEKLNLKPPGGSGFAPHLDTPSLRIALGHAGPQSFVTVMIPIDDMTVENGCLRVVRGAWSEDNHCNVIQPDREGDPDAGGRAGAIPESVAQTQEYEDVPRRGGEMVAFGGWTPHRSAFNRTRFSRRAVFLTFHPKREGVFRDLYYERMGQLRYQYRERMAQTRSWRGDCDGDNVGAECAELAALSTIPKI